MSDLQLLKSKAAHIILDLSYGSSASGALERLSWLTLMIRRTMHPLIFTYKPRKNISQRFDLRYHPDFHGYNSRSTFNIIKTAPKHKCFLWTSINFDSNDLNDLNRHT